MHLSVLHFTRVLANLFCHCLLPALPNFLSASLASCEARREAEAASEQAGFWNMVRVGRVTLGCKYRNTRKEETVFSKKATSCISFLSSVHALCMMTLGGDRAPAEDSGRSSFVFWGCFFYKHCHCSQIKGRKMAGVGVLALQGRAGFRCLLCPVFLRDLRSVVCLSWSSINENNGTSLPLCCHVVLWYNNDWGQVSTTGR